MWRRPLVTPDIQRARARARNVAIGSGINQPGESVSITYGQIQANTIIASRINVSNDIAPAEILSSSRATDLSTREENRRLSTSVSGAAIKEVHAMTGRRKAWVGEDRPSVVAKREAEEAKQRKMAEAARLLAQQNDLRRRQEEIAREKEIASNNRRLERLAEGNGEGYVTMCNLLDHQHIVTEEEMHIRGIRVGDFWDGRLTGGEENLGDLGLSDSVVAATHAKMIEERGAVPLSGCLKVSHQMDRDMMRRSCIFGIRPELLPVADYAYYLVGNVNAVKNSDGDDRVSLTILPAQIHRNEEMAYQLDMSTRVLAPHYIKVVPSLYAAAARRRLPGLMGRNLQAIIAMPRNRTEDIAKYRVSPQMLSRALSKPDLTNWIVDGREIHILGLRNEFGPNEYIVRSF